MWPNYPGTELVGTVLKLRQRMKILPSCARILQKTLNLVISRCCFAEDGKEMYSTLAELLFLLIKPIVLWRCRCRCGSRCLSSLMDQVSYFSLPFLKYPSSFTFLICIFFPSLCAHDLRRKVGLLAVYTPPGEAHSSNSVYCGTAFRYRKTVYPPS